MWDDVYLGMPNFGVSLLAAFLFFSLWGQGETNSAIGGSVTDVTGAAIPAARVTLTSIDNGMKRTVKGPSTTTDDSTCRNSKPGPIFGRGWRQISSPRRKTVPWWRPWGKRKRWTSR